MALIIVLATLTSYAIAWLVNVPVLVPILNTAASFPFMVAALRRGDVGLAVARMLIWALTMGVCATLLSYARPSETDEFFLRHAVHAALFSSLAVATGGIAAMPMGAVLMNYMGHYVGSLAARSAHPALTMILAWHPWAVIRIISFVTLGVVLASPLLGRL